MNTFDKLSDHDKHILKGPPVTPSPEPRNQIDFGLAYVEAMVKLPEIGQNILEVLEDISNSLEILAVCSRRDAEDRNILKPDDIQDLGADNETEPA